MSGFNLPDDLGPYEMNRYLDGPDDAEIDRMEKLHALQNARWHWTDAMSACDDLIINLEKISAPGVYIRRLRGIEIWLNHRGEQIAAQIEGLLPEEGDHP